MLTTTNQETKGTKNCEDENVSVGTRICEQRCVQVCTDKVIY